MTLEESLQLDADLQDLKALRENRIWKNHILPEIERLRNEHRTGMRDRTRPPAERCEHVTGFDDAQTLLEYLDKEERRMREALREDDATRGIITRPFSH